MWGHRKKTQPLESQWPQFGSWPCRVPAVWLWARFLMSLALSFLACKIKTTIVPSSLGCWKIKVRGTRRTANTVTSTQEWNEPWFLSFLLRNCKHRGLLGVFVVGDEWLKIPFWPQYLKSPYHSEKLIKGFEPVSAFLKWGFYMLYWVGRASLSCCEDELRLGIENTQNRV